ncbi:hypothetical protein [Moorena producens]|uniref:hypothetical protein n=1 Tax=Moorena producens TaxID=1155739 RepID=UPI003C7396AA
MTLNLSHQLSYQTFNVRENCQNKSKKNIGEYRLAQGSDFVKLIRSFDQDYTQEQLTCTIFTADFNCPAKEVPRCNL